MDISFVILTWNSRSYVRACLDSIHAALGPTGLVYEVLVFDNGSVDGTADDLAAVASEMPQILKVFSSPTNLGTTRSRNALLRVATGRLLCVMDSDVEVPLGAIAPLVAYLDANPSVGLVVPRINYPSGRWQKSTDRFPTLAGKFNRFFRLRAIERSEEAHLPGVPTEVDYAISAFWLFPRRVLELVGLLDEKIFYAPEDVDYCLRVWKAGFRIVQYPGVTVVHHTQEISRGWKLNRAKLEHLKGLVYYFNKHGYLWTAPVLPIRLGQR